jgi:DedD protein
MKDRRHWQNGVELFLDNRQIFLLFFSSAVVLSLVFALGVVVGKRVERQPSVEPAADPLAMLDQLGGSEDIDDNLTFHEKLVVEPRPPAGDAPTATEDNPPDQAPLQPAAAEPRNPEPRNPEPRNPETRNPETRNPETRNPEPVKLASARAASARAASARAASARAASARAASAKADSARAASARADSARAASARAASARAASSHKQKNITTAKKKQPQKLMAVAETGTASTTQGQYTLQLSSFQDRHEAQQFMRKLRGSGMQPYMVPANIPGRGVWFRVRVGSYGSWDEALAAKEVFEREQQIVAYVAKN